jgi:hypothetical protein
LEGVDLVEMKRNRENSFCCGARAPGEYIPGLSEDTAKERIREFKETEADLLITACAYCKEIFRLKSATWPKDQGISRIPRLGGSHAGQKAALQSYAAAFRARDYERFGI